MKTITIDGHEQVFFIYAINHPDKKGDNANIGKERVRSVAKLLKLLRKDLPDFILDNLPLISPEEKLTMTPEQIQEESEKRIKERNEKLNTKVSLTIESIQFDTLMKCLEGIDWKGDKGWNTIEVGNKLYDVLENAKEYDPNQK